MLHYIPAFGRGAMMSKEQLEALRKYIKAAIALGIEQRLGKECIHEYIREAELWIELEALLKVQS